MPVIGTDENSEAKAPNNKVCLYQHQQLCNCLHCPWRDLSHEAEQRCAKLTSANAVLRETQQYLVEKCSNVSQTSAQKIAELESALAHRQDVYEELQIVRENLSHLQTLSTTLAEKEDECARLKKELKESGLRESLLLDQVDALQTALERMADLEEKRRETDLRDSVLRAQSEVQQQVGVVEPMVKALRTLEDSVSQNQEESQRTAEAQRAEQDRAFADRFHELQQQIKSMEAANRSSVEAVQEAAKRSAERERFEEARATEIRKSAIGLYRYLNDTAGVLSPPPFPSSSPSPPHAKDSAPQDHQQPVLAATATGGDDSHQVRRLLDNNEGKNGRHWNEFDGGDHGQPLPSAPKLPAVSVTSYRDPRSETTTLYVPLGRTERETEAAAAGHHQQSTVGRSGVSPPPVPQATKEREGEHYSPSSSVSVPPPPPPAAEESSPYPYRYAEESSRARDRDREAAEEMDSWR